MNLIYRVLIPGAILVAAFAWWSAPRASSQAGPRDEPASVRHVLLYIGDGMGDSEITAARAYQVGAAGRLSLDTLPFTADVTTYAVEESDPKRPDYVTDSAASGTAWATGVKTSNGRISTTPRDDQDRPTILELAQKAGYRVGLVTTSELTDATPAVQAAHVRLRGCRGPADMAACPQDAVSAGGPGSIAEQQIDHRVDVLLGGGRRHFEQRIEAGPHAGSSVMASAASRGYRVVTTASELSEASSTAAPLLGLFAPGNMDLEWNGEYAAPFPGSGPQRCVEGVRPADQPSLEAMTRSALARLGAGDARFFLQVEGGSIDKQDHAAHPCGQIGETIGLDAAIRAGLEFAHDHPDTLVVVTADHAHTSQIVGSQTPTDHSPGLISTLLTKEGAPLILSYATNLPGRSMDHTGVQVRVAAEGPGADAVHGLIDQTEIFRIITRVMRIQPTH